MEVFMSNKGLTKSRETFPARLEDFFKPWSPWFTNAGWEKEVTVPAVNVSETKENYKVSLAAPGLKKSDFRIDVEASMLTISSEKEETKEEGEPLYTRKEYSYSSFSRSFNLPEEVNQDKIEASYQDGVLNIVLPKKEDAKKLAVSKHIAIK
jgi:HSP20 family protein